MREEKNGDGDGDVQVELTTAAVEAQCAAIGNVGFLGLPMFITLFGEGAIGPNMLVLTVDLIVFSSLIVILVNAGRTGRLSLATFGQIGLGLLKNPMIVSIVAGLGWSALDVARIVATLEPGNDAARRASTRHKNTNKRDNMKTSPRASPATVGPITDWKIYI